MILTVILLILAALYVVMRLEAHRRTEPADIDEQNPYLSMDEDALPSAGASLYRDRVKPALDHLLSFLGLVILSPLFVLISIAVFLDDPGPVFFTQIRVGKDRRYFALHKFRSMKTSTPHDIPTHMLKTPEQYITRVGRVLRKTSLDELPQIWDIFRGRMAVVGPRPALWNQEDLVAERERYGANRMKPGLTGWAQINGRDELEIPVKAEFDGEYTDRINRGGMAAFWMDCRCFFGTFGRVIRHEGVSEGGPKK